MIPCEGLSPPRGTLWDGFQTPLSTSFRSVTREFSVSGARETSSMEAARRTGPANRQAERRLGRADVEQFIAAYSAGSLRCPTRRPFRDQPHHGARSSRAQRCPSVRGFPSSSTRTPTKLPTPIATGSRSPQSATVSELTLPRSVRHFCERACRLAGDAVGRVPERGITLPAMVLATYRHRSAAKGPS